MDRLNLLETLVTAVDQGSLNRAAQQLGLSQPAVSQHIKHLEHLFGQPLLNRSATGVQPTRAGTLAVSHARDLLKGFATLETELTPQADNFTGNFRVSVGNMLGRVILAPLLIEMGQCYPDLNIIVRMDDRCVDVVAERFDLAIRAGGLGPTSGYGRKIGALQTVLVAAPSYLAQAGHPSCPDDLRTMKYVQYGENTHSNVLKLNDGETWRTIDITTGFTVDDPQMLLDVMATGIGFTHMPLLLAEPEICAGKLAIILPQFQTQDKSIYAVHPTPSGYDPVQSEILRRLQDRLSKITRRPLQNAPVLKMVPS
ncbi:LysR family transcriptional regulator [Epibacterium ulvae]|uniref:LysR family transcriptional regulator n=1 Tax=Epibacterium ulvae TaxID=1156985 RepID=UPI00249097D9|nr:LysR family transcriptional regulator [Epibacterium ulvae]